MASTWLVVAVALPLIAVAQVSVPNLRGKLPTADNAVTALGTDLFGDRINLYSGSFEIEQTDFELPGNNALQVSLVRKHTPGRRHTVRGALADWDLLTPHIGGTFAAQEGWAASWQKQISATNRMPALAAGVGRCTGFSAPPGVSRSNPGGSADFQPWEYWQGTMLSVPGESSQEILRRSLGNTLAPGGATSTFPLITRSQWQIGCLPTLRNGSGEGFFAISPQGVRYDFDWMATREADSLQKGDNVLLRQDVYLMASTVRDRFGNWVQYEYDPAQPLNLLRILSSDQRTITLNYAGTSRVQSATDGSRTWSYVYAGFRGGEIRLANVVLPDSSRWSFNLRELVANRSSPEDFSAIGCDLSSSPPTGSGPLAGSMIHPSGAQVTFLTNFAFNPVTNVQRLCETLPGSVPPLEYNPLYSREGMTQALVSKTISGPGLPNLTWTYGSNLSIGSWAPCIACPDRKIVTVTEPGNFVKRYHYGIRWRENESQLLRLEDGWNGSTALRTIDYRYRAGGLGQSYRYSYGTSVVFVGNELNYANFPQDLRKITQQQTEFVWQADDGFLGFDEFARPTSWLKSNTLGISRRDAATFEDNRSLWVIGQPREVIEAGRTRERFVYSAATALPVERYTFDRQVARYEFHPAGTLRTVFDPVGRATRFDDYFRGIPRLVTHRDGTTERAGVNNYGAVESYTNQLNISTSYGYDTVGRLASITYPNETDLSYHPTLISYQQVNSDELGLNAGHWRQTTSTGQARTIRYFDALWRPRLVRTFDAANSTTQATTGSDVETRYHPAGQRAFESYPLRGLTVLDQASNAVPGKRWSYDALGREIEMQQDSELGILSTQTAYLGGFKRVITNPRGLTTTHSFQAFDIPSEDTLTQALLPENVTLDIARDPWGKASSITRSGTWNSAAISATRSYVYDTYQRLCKTIEPETGATLQAYDSAGNVNWRASGLNLNGSICDINSVPASSKAVFGYDAMDRVTSTTFGDGSPPINRTYTPDGLTASNSSGGWTWTMDYNNRRLLWRETYAYPVVAPGEVYPTVRVYNAYGHQQRMDYWGGLSVDYAPNALGQPTQASGFAANVSWHPNGMLASYTRPGTTRSFNMQLNLRQLPRVWADSGVMDDEISYDRNGNIIRILDRYSGLNTRDMGYDALDRLRSASGVWGVGSFDYDGLDNLRASTVGTRTMAHQYDPATQRLTGLTGSLNLNFNYDVQGNITSRGMGNGAQGFVFDIANRMTRADNVPGAGTVQYTYDGNGRRAWAQYPNGTHRGFAYAQDGKLLIVGDTVNSRIADWYFYLGDRQIGQTSLRSGPEFVHTDYLGSVAARSTTFGVDEASRTRYEPYGRVSSGYLPVGAGFTGHVHDSDTALINMQQRYYEPLAGRFLSVDPVTTDAMTGSHFNRYVYGENNPYKFKDLDGRASTGALIPDEAGGGGRGLGARNLDGTPVRHSVAESRASLAEARAQLKENVAQGKAGEAVTRDKLGDKVAGEQVTFKTSDGTRTRVDFVTTDKGAVETKTGGSQLSTGQGKFKADVDAGRQVTPVGQNAANAGLSPGQPTTMSCCTIDRVRGGQ